MEKLRKIAISVILSCLLITGCSDTSTEDNVKNVPAGTEITSTNEAINIYLDGIENNDRYIQFYTGNEFNAEDAVSAVSRKAVQAKKNYAMCNVSGCTMTTTKRDDGYTEVTIEMRYYMSKEEYDYVDTRVSQIAQYLKKDTDYETYRAVYEWVCTHVQYDYDTVNGDADRFSAYHALKEGKAVCYGYSALFQKFCDVLGMECMVLTSLDDTAHAWNVVKLDGEYYHVDCTFGTTASKEVPDWRYFLCGQDKIKYGSGYGVTLARESYTKEK